MKKFNIKLRHKPWLVFTLFLVLVLILGMWRFHKATLEGGPPPTPVETAVVRVAPFNHTLSAIGILQSNEAIMLRPEISGRIAKIYFTEGQTVEKGQSLIDLEDSIDQANLKEAQADFTLRSIEFKRAETLAQRAAGSLTDKDLAFSKMQVSEAMLVKAQATLAKMHITAAFDGFIGLRKVNVGDFVTPGQDLVNLVDLDPIKVDFRVPEIYLEKIKLNQTVDVITDALPDQTFVGKIYAIDPQIDPIGHSILIRAVIDNKEHKLRPGLFAKIQIILQHVNQALFIPTEALMPQENKQFVFKIEKDTVVLTEVKVGERQPNEVEIIEGLKAGDTVVTAGQMKIGPGAKVKPIPTSLVPEKTNNVEQVNGDTEQSNKEKKLPNGDTTEQSSKDTESSEDTTQSKANPAQGSKQ